jgi:glycosyltransferase involved in cell wall biosynthesis
MSLNDHMKVSILIPTYNSEKHLAECLDTVLTQDFADMEILLSDDCSTDGTIRMIESYAKRDRRVRWWRNPENLGFVPNHNHILREASGDYVKYIHADDKLLSDSAVRKMAEALDQFPSVVLVGCEQHLTDTDKAPTILSKQSGIHEGRKMMTRCWEQNTNLIGQPTLTMFRRAAAARGFDSRFEGHLDYEMWFHLLEQGDFYYLAEKLATWRVHKTQKTAVLNRDGSSSLEYLNFVETYFARPSMRAAATGRMLFTQIHYLEKKYGRAARHLTSAMRSQLSQAQFAREWLRHSIARPIQKLKRKAARWGGLARLCLTAWL